MLEIADVTLQIESNQDTRTLLDGISVRYPLSHFGAIIGPSGCGKTTILKLIAGIAPGKETGEVRWKARNLHEEDFYASEIAYIPQFGIAHEELTVRECVRFSLALRVCAKIVESRNQTVTRILDEVGLRELENQTVRTLSGGQRRRLALAIELTSSPELLLCDEVTSGLDSQAQNDIVQLLLSQSRDAGRLVLSVTHNLEQLELYDSVLVLCRGFVAYHGSPALLAGYFGLATPSDLYTCLDRRAPQEWDVMWRHHRDALDALLVSDQESWAVVGDGNLKRFEASAHPDPLSQFRTLLLRRVMIFSRCKSQMLLQLGFVFGFPLIVALFAWNGLPAIQNLSMGLDGNGFKQIAEAREFLIHSSKVGSLVSGIMMFQVILLTLMGANNSGREIAAERLIFEKEKLSGLSPVAYIASKAAFLFLFTAVQSVWMGVFVHVVCGFPGDLPAQLGYLLLSNAAITSVCLAISSMMRSPEQASLVSIYLVGFQLPLSGAVLALPEPLGFFVRPLISAYWGWAGMLQTLSQERYFDIVQSVVQSPLAPPALCVWILGAHIAVGIFVAWIGCERRLPW